MRATWGHTCWGVVGLVLGVRLGGLWSSRIGRVYRNVDLALDFEVVYLIAGITQQYLSLR